jgi:hypothetical protein
MNNFYLLIAACFLGINSYAQEPNGRLNKSGEKLTNVIFDYFRQEHDSIVYLVGSTFLMPSDSLTFKDKNQYKVKVINPEKGYLEIYFKGYLLYKYELLNNQVQGSGFVYYPFKKSVALQGRFANGKLDGLVFVQSQEGEMIEVMKFKNGKYINHVFHWLSPSKNSLKRRSKNRSSNPLRNDEVIVR